MQITLQQHQTRGFWVKRGIPKELKALMEPGPTPPRLLTEPRDGGGRQGRAGHGMAGQGKAGPPAAPSQPPSRVPPPPTAALWNLPCLRRRRRRLPRSPHGAGRARGRPTRPSRPLPAAPGPRPRGRLSPWRRRSPPVPAAERWLHAAPRPPAGNGVPGRGRGAGWEM